MTCDCFFFLQQFVTWGVRADCGSYFITMYIQTEMTKGLKKGKDKREQKKKKKRKMKCLSYASLPVWK